MTRQPLNVTVDKDIVFIDNAVIGRISDRRFVQKTHSGHIFRKLNSKGIEFDVYQRLLHENVSIWRLEFTDTGQIMEIPLRLILECGILNPRGSAGYQYHVKMRFFNVIRAAIQKAMFSDKGG